MKEEWKPVIGFSNYEVSSLGRFRNVKRGKFLKPSWNKGRQYLYANFVQDGVRKNCRAHRVVAIHFIENPENLPQVNHKDCDKDNNRADNLEWVGRSRNMEHAKENGRMWSHKGELAYNSKLKNETVLKIVEEHKKGKSHSEVARMFGTNYSNVAHIIRGSRWGTITGIKYVEKIQSLDNTF